MSGREFLKKKIAAVPPQTTHSLQPKRLKVLIQPQSESSSRTRPSLSEQLDQASVFGYNGLNVPVNSPVTPLSETPIQRTFAERDHWVSSQVAPQTDPIRNSLNQLKNQPLNQSQTVQRKAVEPKESANHQLILRQTITQQKTEEAGEKSSKGFWGKVTSLFKGVVYNSDFKSLSGAMYRITDEKIQRVERRVEKGKPHYVATHKVEIENISEDELPKETPEFEDLKDWYPKVTHINGMQVKPKEGISGAKQLQELLKENGMKDPDVLYTYSSTSGLLTDLVECIGGKLSIGGKETESQETLILDAVKNQHRTTISAHSRGTIKTDNAIRNVHKILSQESFEAALNSNEAQEAQAAAIQEYLQSGAAEELGLSPSIIGEIAAQVKAQEIADHIASEQMNTYIHLIYAGNAVEFPSTVLKGDLYVAPGNWYSLWNMDYISFLVGSNFALGQKLKGTENMTLHRLKPEEVGSEIGGHNFTKHYVGAVAKNIIEDMKKQQR